MSIRNQWYRSAGVGAMVAVALTLTACSSGGASSGGTSPATSSSAGSGGSTDPGVAYAQKQVDDHTAVNTSGFLPTTPIPGLSKLKGKTVVYIPAVAQIPIFQTGFKAYVNALKAVGVTAKLCDGQSNPSAVAACLQQAINTNAGGVIMDSLPPIIAQQAYDAVLKAKIPVLLVTTSRPANSPDSVQLGGPDIPAATAIAADAAIAATKGKGNILAVRVIDSPSTVEWMNDGGLKEFTAHCPGCKVKVIETKSADLQNLPSKVSSALLATSDTNYLLPQFSAEVDGTFKGAADASRTELKGVNTVTTTGDLQKIKAGQGLQYSVGWDTVRESWVNTDLLLRLMTGQKVDGAQYTVPVRVFDKSNVGSLDLTQNGWDTSNWYGGTGYQDSLKALWAK